jgi:hypothetical protein
LQIEPLGQDFDHHVVRFDRLWQRSRKDEIIRGSRAGDVKRAQLFGPVWSVVGGGLGTILVVMIVAFAWPEVRRLKSLSGEELSTQGHEESQFDPTS